jgi:hypothetical protein
VAERVNRLVRPPWEEVAKIHASIQCSCGRTLHMVHETREHWQRGHFDREGSPMLTEEELLALIVVRLGNVSESCNTARREAIWDEIRGLVFVLNQKSIGSLRAHDDSGPVLDLCGIPWKHFGPKGSEEGTEVPEAWLKEHGFVEVKDGDWRHPKFG